MTRPSCLFLLSILAIACLLPIRPVEAQAEIRRCVTDSGATIYTDRNCADVGAAERLPRLTADAGGAHTQLPSRGSCVRRVQDLVHELTRAIDRGDVNQLASLYHWPGIGTRNGYAIMDRLDAIVQRAGGAEAIMEDPDLIPQVHIRGDVNAPWRCVAGTIYNIQRAGYPTVGFISNPVDPNA